MGGCNPRSAKVVLTNFIILAIFGHFLALLAPLALLALLALLVPLALLALLAPCGWSWWNRMGGCKPRSAQVVLTNFWLREFSRGPFKVTIEKSRGGRFSLNRNWDLGWIWASLATFDFWHRMKLKKYFFS